VARGAQLAAGLNSQLAAGRLAAGRLLVLVPVLVLVLVRRSEV